MSPIIWNVSPDLLHLGPITFRWYGVLFALCFAAGFQITKAAFIREKRPLIYVDYLIFYMMVGTVVGARLGHTLFYEPDIYLRDPIRILKIWEGGLASHGAAVGIFTAMWLFCRKYRDFTFLWVCDRNCIGVAISGFLIRTGNLFNSEILGKPTHADWGVVFARVDQIPRHPAQVYEALSYLMIFFFLYRMYWKTKWYKVDGVIFGSFLVLCFGARFFLEFFKENQVGFEASLPLNMGQLLSIPLVIAGAALVIRGYRREKSLEKRPAKTPSKTSR
jgi:phosphatidylglycerol:prolipoprotein diacylglycerol transferase